MKVKQYKRLRMENHNNNATTEPTEKLAFTLSDYKSFVENGGCNYTDCNECEYHAECGNFAEY